MFRRTLLAVAAAAGLACGQEVEKPLTNGDVAAMLKAGLAEATIARAIVLAAERGTTRFDTSPQALIDLKNQGATAGILDTMLAAAALPKRVLPSTTVPGLPADRGVYYHAGERWVDLPSILVWPHINTTWRGTTAIEDRRYVIAGAEAGLRVREATPSFYLRGMDPHQSWHLVRLDTKRDYREWRTAPADVLRFARSIEPAQARAPELQSRMVAQDVFELHPASALEPGQYALTMLMPGQHWVVVAYEFAVPGGQSR